MSQRAASWPMTPHMSPWHRQSTTTHSVRRAARSAPPTAFRRYP